VIVLAITILSLMAAIYPVGPARPLLLSLCPHKAGKRALSDGGVHKFVCLSVANRALYEVYTKTDKPFKVKSRFPDAVL